MRVLITPDAPNWAIGALCKSIMKHNPQIEFVFVPAHPRGLGEAIPAIQEALQEGIDLWHAHYWNSAIQLLDLIPQLRDPKLKKVLTHHNHHRLTKRDWRTFDMVTIATDFGTEVLKANAIKAAADHGGFDTLTEWTDWGVDVLKKVHPNVKKVTYGIDLDRFSYLNDYPPKEPAVGYVGRVAPWKNLAEITRVSKELGYKVRASGFVDKPEYWATVDKSNLEFNGGIGLNEMAPAHIKDDLYKQMTVFVMYSTEEKESGTLPLLEAMARGVPVMATEQGMARELIKDGVNGVIFTPETFKEKLKALMEDEPLRKSMRQAAWETIKNYPEEKMAREFAKVYHDTLYPDHPLVSVVITSFNRPEALLDSILSIEAQLYPNKEIIVADDGSTDPRVANVVGQLQSKIKTPLRFVRNPQKTGYDLGKMRNLAVMEALGSHILIFQDRFKLDDGMLERIANTTVKNTWGHGAKIINGQKRDKKSFIENFAWILKDDLVRAGMFNERIDLYGGQSEELRKRFTAQGFLFNHFPEITATEIISSRAGARRGDIWKAKLKIHKLYDHV